MSEDYGNLVLKSIRKAKNIAIDNGTYTKTGIFSLSEFTDLQTERTDKSIKRKAESDDEGLDENTKKTKLAKFITEREKELIRMYNRDVEKCKILSQQIQENLERCELQNSITKLSTEFWDGYRSEIPLNVDKILKDIL